MAEINIDKIGGSGGALASGVLQTPNPLDVTLQRVEDQSSTQSLLQLSTTSTNALGVGASTTQLGDNAIAEGNNDIAIGTNAWSSVFGFGDTSISIGRNSFTQFGKNVVIGDGALAPQGGSVAIGGDASAFGQGIVIGYQSAIGSGGNQQIVIGSGTPTPVGATDIIAIGDGIGTIQNTISIGNFSQTQSGLGSVVIGHNAQSQGFDSVAIGMNVFNGGDNSVTIGSSVSTQNQGSNSVAINGIGFASNVVSINGFAFGQDSIAIRGTAMGDAGVSIGVSANCENVAGVCIGSGSQTTNFGIDSGAIAIGQGASALDGAISIGNSTATNFYGIAIGHQSFHGGDYAVTLGESTFADSGGVAIGRGANAPAFQIAFGSVGSNTGAVNPTADVPATFLWDVIVNGNPYKILMTT